MIVAVVDGGLRGLGWTASVLRWRDGSVVRSRLDGYFAQSRCLRDAATRRFGWTAVRHRVAAARVYILAFAPTFNEEKKVHT